MRAVFTIAAREVRSNFVTPLAYAICGGFLICSGLFFVQNLATFNKAVAQTALFPGARPNFNQFVIEPFYQAAEVILVFLLPLMTMRGFALERERGTFELLVTSPLSVSEIVFGKFLGICTIVVIMLGISFVFPLSLIIFADPEVAPTLVGFMGLILFSFSYVAVGLAVSALTKDQTLAGVLGLVVMLLLFVISMGAESLQGWKREVMLYLSPVIHSGEFFKGILSVTDLVYFLSLMSLGLFLAARALEAERLK